MRGSRRGSPRSSRPRFTQQNDRTMSIDFKLRDFRYPLSILRLRRQFERSQWSSRESLIRDQERRLRRIVEHACQNVPYYRDTFTSIGLSPGDIRTLADLPKIPTLSKADLRAQYPRLQAEGRARFHPREARTSGTSGEPVRFLLDRSANVLEFVYYWRHWNWAGYRLGDRFAELSSHAFLRDGARASRASLFQPLTGRLLLNSLALSPAIVLEFVRAIRAHRPRFLKGIASSLTYLASFFREAGVDNIRFRAIFSTGEMLTPGHRRFIQEVFGCKVYDSYGHMERTVAVSECPEGSLHINTEYGILETVERVPLGPAPRAGGGTYTARVVGTSLHNFSMPLLRYQVGDLVELEDPDPACACGRGLPTIRRVLGREGDAIKTPDGRVVTTLFIVFDEVRGVERGQVIQEAIDRLRLRVVRGPEYSARSEDDLLRCVRRFVGCGIAIELEYLSHDDFLGEAGGGKFRAVVSRIPAATPLP
jgi:phenylacetate-CoA ligase